MFKSQRFWIWLLSETTCTIMCNKKYWPNYQSVNIINWLPFYNFYGGSACDERAKRALSQAASTSRQASHTHVSVFTVYPPSPCQTNTKHIFTTCSSVGCTILYCTPPVIGLIVNGRAAGRSSSHPVPGAAMRNQNCITRRDGMRERERAPPDPRRHKSPAKQVLGTSRF